MIFFLFIWLEIASVVTLACHYTFSLKVLGCLAQSLTTTVTPPSIALSLSLLSQETSRVCSLSLLALKLLCSSLQNTSLILQSLSFQVLHTCKVLVGYSLMEQNLFYLFPRKFCSASEKKRCPRCIFILLSIGLNQVPLSEAGPAHFPSFRKFLATSAS